MATGFDWNCESLYLVSINSPNMGSSPISEDGELFDEVDGLKSRNRSKSKSASVWVSVLNCSISPSFGPRRTDVGEIGCTEKFVGSLDEIESNIWPKNRNKTDTSWNVGLLAFLHSTNQILWISLKWLKN